MVFFFNIYQALVIAYAGTSVSSENTQQPGWWPLFALCGYCGYSVGGSLTQSKGGYILLKAKHITNENNHAYPVHLFEEYCVFYQASNMAKGPQLPSLHQDLNEL